jgi:arylsulfatase A-like enzyme
MYDATVRYVDEQIGVSLDALERVDAADNTIVVVCGDHGEELAEHGDFGHHYRLYEHNLRVPLLFYRRGLKGQRLSGLTTLMDVAPTMADMSGVRGCSDWEGVSLAAPQVDPRDHVLAETFHGGRCHFAGRPVYIAVRRGPFKYVWKEARDRTDAHSPEGLELYDISVDPLERVNIYRDDHPELPRLNSIVIDRLRELPSFTAERIRRAFGENAVAAAETAAVSAY